MTGSKRLEQKTAESIVAFSNKLSADVQNSLSADREQLRTLIEQAGAARDAATEAAARQGITAEAKQFETSMIRYRNQSNWWMALLFILILLGVGFGAWLFHDLPIKVEQFIGASSTGANAESGSYSVTNMLLVLAAPRLIIFTMLYFCLIWTSRNYSAAKHNQIVNEHRVNALSTFLAFANGTKDPKIQDAILLQASSCAFAAQVSGFMKDEAPSQENTKIVEIVREAAK